MHESDSRPGMLQDPALSRQWILRRLQKALTADLAILSLVTGLERSAGDDWAPMLALARESLHSRAALEEGLIRREGGMPYSSVGLARRASRLGGRLLGVLGARAWRPLLVRLTEHSYAELDALVAFTRGAPGISEQMAGDLAPEVERSRQILERLRRAAPAPS